MPAISLEARLTVAAVLACIASAAAGIAVQVQTGSWPMASAAALAVAVLAGLLAARAIAGPLRQLLRALHGAVASFRDGDFSFSISSARRDELGELARIHSELSRTLREQRQHLVQRELLLDTVVQNTPVALVLVDDLGHVAYANLAARQLFNDNRSLVGLSFRDIAESGPTTMREAIAAGSDALFTVDFPEGEETFHLSQRGFRLHGRTHRLYLFRRMTRELSRQEVATWKKVIRVMSHELNNSLAPISSLAHSGAELARRGQSERLPDVFASIASRARHLHAFIEGYATFARLPAPRLESVRWPAFIATLQPQAAFRIVGGVPDAEARFDPAQLEQVLINLLKNAHEAGSPPDDVELEIRRVAGSWRIEVRDRGAGMSETVLANALLPFYSTKRSGTGLGLALTREIIEAHGGRIQLANRSDVAEPLQASRSDGHGNARQHAGLQVSLTLPA